MKRLITGVLIAAVSALATVNANAADCEDVNKQIAEKLKTIRSKQTGGFNGENVDAEVAEVKQLAESSKCPMGPLVAHKPTQPGVGNIIDSDFAPLAPGENKVVEDPTYEPNFKLPAIDLTKLIPTKDHSAETADPGFQTPHKDEMFGKGVCGTLASKYLEELKKLQGEDRPVYKEGCSGTASDTCAANEFGKFGLVEAAYNNGQQSINIDNLASKTPGTMTIEEAVAFKDTQTGISEEVNGCRLSNYASCGKAGDIIMVQSNTGATTTDVFDTFLVYDGNGRFYEITNNTTQPLRSGSLDPTYNSMSYAAIRLSCAESGSGGDAQASN